MVFLSYGTRPRIAIFSMVSMVAVGLIAIAWSLWWSPTTSARILGSTDSSSTMSNSTCNVAVTASCQRLRSELGATAVILPSDSQYSALREENWSQTTWQHPICIAIPGSAVDVQKLVSELAANEIPFAVRSGGHSPNPFDANIDVGVLIALNNLDEVTYHDETGLASIGPGARWDAVYTALDPYNVTVVGGRVMDVGVGGLILGGGLSYLSDLYGLACDNVQSFEVTNH